MRETQKIIDLTFSIHEGMCTFPVLWHPIVEITQLGRLGIENRETRKLIIGTHTGTHLDAPRHFIPNGKTVEDISLEILIGPAHILNLAQCKPGQEIGVADLEKMLGTSKPERLVLRFDWDKYWGTMDYYTNHPFISTEAAQWIVDRGIRLLAMDTPMPDNPTHGRGNDPDSPVHKILLKNNIVIVEYLCNLKEIRYNEVELIVLPLKIRDGDGSPVRCVAIEKSER